MLLANLETIFRHEQAEGLPCEWVASSPGFETCAHCARERRSQEDTTMRSHVYRVTHYVRALLKAYHLRDRPVPETVHAGVRAAWLQAGQPPPTKRALQSIMQTRRDPKWRPYLRSWRQLSHRLGGVQPPPLSGDALRSFLGRFGAVHRAYGRLGYYKQRPSFLSLPFTFRRCLELEGLDGLKEHFPGLRGADKFVETYRKWARICRHLRWPIVVATF